MIGGVVDLTLQVFGNRDAGDTWGEAFSNIDSKSLVISVAAGAVAGGTMGLGTGIMGTGYGAVAISGVASGVAGGQTAAVVNGTWDEIESYMDSGEFQLSEMVRGALEAGLLDGESIMYDAAVGSVTATLGKGFSSFLNNGLQKAFGGQSNVQPITEIKMFGGRFYIETSGGNLEFSQKQMDEIFLSFASGAIDTFSDILQEAVQKLLE